MNKKALIAASIVTLAAIIVLCWTGVLHANDENIASSISEVWGDSSQWGSINTGSSQQNVSGKTLTSSSKTISPLPGEESRNLAISSGLTDSTSSKTHVSSSASSKAESASTPYSSAVSSKPSPSSSQTSSGPVSRPSFSIPPYSKPSYSRPMASSTGSSSQSGGNTSSFVQKVVELTNQERIQEGLEPLSISKAAEAAAAVRAEEIVSSFSHTRPNGSNFSTALKEQGTSYRTSGENIAWGQKTPEEVVTGWMNSSGHRANILNSKFTSIGVGVYRSSSGRLYWVQLFTG